MVLAAASAVVAGHRDARAVLDDALEIVEDRFWEESAGMVREGWDRAFTEPEPYRGVNATMHGVEALLAAFDATADARWLDRALRLTERVVDGFARGGVRGGRWRLCEHYDPSWHALPGLQP